MLTCSSERIFNPMRYTGTYFLRLESLTKFTYNIFNIYICMHNAYAWFSLFCHLFQIVLTCDRKCIIFWLFEKKCFFKVYFRIFWCFFSFLLLYCCSFRIFWCFFFVLLYCFTLFSYLLMFFFVLLYCVLFYIEFMQFLSVFAPPSFPAFTVTEPCDGAQRIEFWGDYQRTFKFKVIFYILISNGWGWTVEVQSNILCSHK